MANTNPSTKQLKPFLRGTYDPRRNLKGRNKKFITVLKEAGYSKSEIVDTISVMLAATPTELEGIGNNENATVLEITVANALKRGMNNGSLYVVETLITRVHGEPTQQINVNSLTDQDIEIVLTHIRDNAKRI